MEQTTRAFEVFEAEIPTLNERYSIMVQSPERDPLQTWLKLKSELEWFGEAPLTTRFTCSLYDFGSIVKALKLHGYKEI